MQQSSEQLWKTRLAIPAYRVGEAASYAQISPSTVAAWHRLRSGQQDAVLSQKKSGEGLSFYQLIELAVAAEMRRLGVKLKEIDRARAWFKSETGLEHPFAQLRFKTDGADILREYKDHNGQVVSDKLIAANHHGQLLWTEMLSKRLKEFNYDEDGSVIGWKVAGTDKPVKIDPRLAFGAPQVSGVRTATLKSRWVAGEEIDELADDFSISENDVVEALLFEGITGTEPRISKWMN